MTEPKKNKLRDFVRENVMALGVGLVLVVVLSLGVRWVLTHREAGPPRKVVKTFTGVIVKPEPMKPTAPPPPPVVRPKMDEPRQRVEMKTSDLAPPPQAAPAGRLSLASEATGEGDAFNLAGNPGGRGILTGGGLGDGTGDEIGSGDDSSGRYGWYYAKLAADIEDAYRNSKRITAASVRVELKVWVDTSGRVRRVELVRSTGDPELDTAIQSVVGLRLRSPPPPGIPMPMIARLTARRAGSD